MAKRRMYSKTKKSNYKGGKRKMSRKVKKSRKGGTKSRANSSSTKSYAKTQSKVKKNDLQESRKNQKANLMKLYNDKKRKLDQFDDEIISNNNAEAGLAGMDLSGNFAMERRKAQDELDKIHYQITHLDHQIKRCEQGNSCPIMG
jgi:hypothetical protein